MEPKKIVVVGLAPGLKEANRTRKIFNGDFSGDLLFKLLNKNNFSLDFNKSKEIIYTKCRITNAVKCLPPNNIPKSNEIKKCNIYLSSEIQNMKNLEVILTLGQIAHNSSIIALNKSLSEYKFKHLKKHKISNKIILINCYHCSKYNINTKRLKFSDLDYIFTLIRELLNF